MANKRLPKVEIPTFGGTLPEDVSNYLKTFEKIATANGWTDADKTAYLPLYLTGNAQLFYANLETRNDTALATWAAIKQAYTTRFRTAQWTENLKHQIKQLKQRPGQPASDYIDLVMSKCQSYKVDMTQEKLMRYVKLGLCPELLDKIAGIRYQDVEDLRSALLDLEILLRRLKQKREAENRTHQLQSTVNELRLELEQQNIKQTPQHNQVYKTGNPGNWRHQGPQPPYQGHSNQNLRKGKYCDIHRSNNHSTDKCRLFRKTTS